MRSRNWFARVTITCWAGSFVPVAAMSPASFIGQVMSNAHGFGLVTALGILTGVSLVDSLVNDALPPRFSFTGMNYRHMGFMGMSIILVLLGAKVAWHVQSPIVLLSFLSPAVFAVWVTWLDLFERHRPRQGVPA